MNADTMIGTMQSAATGSAHHQPNAAFNNTPANAIIDKYAHKDVWRASARRAPLCIAEATFNLARARRGMTTTDIERMTMPAIVLSGRSRNHRVLALSTETYTASARKQTPTNRWVTFSDRERRGSWISDRRRHCAAPLALTSMTLSMPKPMSATLPATTPAASEAIASRELYPIVA